MNSHANKKKIGLKGCLFLGIGAFALFLLVPLLFFLAWSNRSAQRLNQQVGELRAAGLPTNAEELNDYYFVAPGEDSAKYWIPGAAPLAAPAFQQQAASLPFVGSGEQEIPPPPAPWPQQAQAEQLLADYASSLNLFHQAAQQGGAAHFPLDFSQGLAMPLEHVQSLRNAARLLALEAHVRARQGDVDGAVASMTAINAAADSLAKEPLLISHLVRLAIRGMAIDCMARLTPHLDLTDEHWQDLHRSLERHDGREGLRRAINGERALGLMALRNPAMLEFEAANLGKGLRPRNEDMAFYLESMARFAQTIDLPPGEAIQAAKAVQDDVVATTQKSPFNRFRYPGTGLLFPASLQLLQASLDADARRDVGLTMLAIHRFRQARQRWPESLQELVPAFLPSVPRDPYDGQPLRYRLEEDGYVLYSVGGNGLDEQGLDTSRQDVAIRVRLTAGETPRP